MTTIVGIFEASERVDEAIRRLAAAELESEVLDETSLEQEPGSIDPAGPALVRGAAAAAEAGSDKPNLLPRRDKHSIARAFKERLAKDYHLSDEISDAYATTFSHSGKFVLTRADDKNAERAMQMLRDSGATRVDRHD
jgi:hypothetical protein